MENYELKQVEKECDEKSKNIKVSFYCTVLNEESSIKPLLDSILSQSRCPDEIIIVDGGSTDKTVEMIKEYLKRESSIKLIIVKGANVAQGRNIGIENTTYNIIASTDADCVADKDWLKNLIEKFNDDIDIVGGVGLPDARNTFELCTTELIYPTISDYRADWPEQHNIAFRKHVWEKLKYPEYCYRSEDTWFKTKAREERFKFRLAKDSIIYFRPRKNLREVFKNRYLWTKSDVENDIEVTGTSKKALESIQTLTWNLLCFLMLIFVFIFISRVGAVILAPFLLKNMFKLYKKDKSISKTIYKNLIAYTEMLARSFGFVAGKIAKRKNVS